jgi:hypothetical protein
MSDAAASDHYSDPANREPAVGRPRRRQARPLTQHVPVRFSAQTIEQVRRVAGADGMTISAWIRRAVDRELRQQGPVAAEGEATLDARTAIRRLERDVADLAAALERSGAFPPSAPRRAVSSQERRQ